MRLPLSAVLAPLLVWAAASCNTEHVAGYTAGKGVVGNNCPKPQMQDGEFCQAVCARNSTVVGTVKCLAGNLMDVSMCVPSNVMNTLSVASVTKVMGAWSIGLSKEPSKYMLTTAVNSAFRFPKHFTECVWQDSKQAGDVYVVKYWIIVKPGMDSQLVIDKAKEVVLSNSTLHARFKASLEGDGLVVANFTESAPPTALQTVSLKDPGGRNVNPFETSPGGVFGLNAWG